MDQKDSIEQNDAYLLTEQPDQEHRIFVPDEDVFLQSVQALYQEIRQLRRTVQSQKEQLQTMAVELMLLGHWKPMNYVNELLDFPHDCYLVANYDFISGIPNDTAENPEMAVLKRKIYDLFCSCFLPDFPNCCCEGENGLNTVLLNVPNFGRDHAEEEHFLTCSGRFIHRAASELQVTLKLVLSFCCRNPAQLPEALQETIHLRQLQDAFPHASQILYAGRLELCQDNTSELSQENLEEQLNTYVSELNISAAHQCLIRLTMLELQKHHNLEKLKTHLEERLETMHRRLHLSGHRMDLLVDAQNALGNAHKLDELLLALNQYFSSVDIFLQEADHHRQKQTQAETIRAYVDGHYTEPALSLSALSKVVDMNENQISKAFKNAYGIGILYYIQNLRVERAKILLQETNASIVSVSSRAGFSSRRTFDRVFQKFAGITAAQYQREHTAASANDGSHKDKI